MTQQGFTLIELLIVIAIIGILAVALLPNLNRARQQGYNAASQSCAKHIALTEEMFYIDRDQYASSFDELKTFDPGALKPCVENLMQITGNATGNTTQHANYTYTVTHNQGSKTYTVTKNGVISGPRQN